MSARVPPGGYAPGRKLSRGSGKGLTVGPLLATGGLGYIYEVAGDRDLVFKQIKPEALPKTPDLEARLVAMVAQPPPRWTDSSGHVLLAWPVDTVFADSRFVGFVMPRIDAARGAEIHIVSNPSDRRAPASTTPGWVRGFTWQYLLQTAANLALATEVLHAGGSVFGDFNDRNILVTDDARVTFLDCDSMQIPNPNGGGAFLCSVGRPEFTAPELVGLNLKIVPRPASSDLFPLAVHIHQLLVEGSHPFDGVWHGKGEKPKRLKLAKEGLYVYAGDRRLTPQPLAMDYSLLPAPLQQLFRRAFVSGARDPSLRPDGREWQAALNVTRNNLQTCKKVKEHVYPGEHRSCPWCKYDARIAITQAQTPLPPAPNPRRPIPQPGPTGPYTTVRNAPTTPALSPWRLLRRRLRFALPLTAIGGFLAGSYTFSSQTAVPNGLGPGLEWCGVCALAGLAIAFLFDVGFGGVPPERRSLHRWMTALGAGIGLVLWWVSFQGQDPSPLGWLAPPLFAALGHGAALCIAGRPRPGLVRYGAAVAATFVALGCAATVVGLKTQHIWMLNNFASSSFRGVAGDAYSALHLTPAFLGGVPVTSPPPATTTSTPPVHSATGITKHKTHRTHRAITVSKTRHTATHSAGHSTSHVSTSPPSSVTRSPTTTQVPPTTTAPTTHVAHKPSAGTTARQHSTTPPSGGLAGSNSSSTSSKPPPAGGLTGSNSSSSGGSSGLKSGLTGSSN